MSKLGVQVKKKFALVINVVCGLLLGIDHLNSNEVTIAIPSHIPQRIPDLYAFIGFIVFIGPDDINYMC